MRLSRKCRRVFCFTRSLRCLIVLTIACGGVACVLTACGATPERSASDVMAKEVGLPGLIQVRSTRSLLEVLRHPDCESRVISLETGALIDGGWMITDRQLLEDGSVLFEDIEIGRDAKAATIRSVTTSELRGKEREMRLIAALVSMFSVYGDRHGSGGTEAVIHATRRGAVYGAFHSYINPPTDPLPAYDPTEPLPAEVPHAERLILQTALDALDHNLMIPSSGDAEGGSGDSRGSDN